MTEELINGMTKDQQKAIDNLLVNSDFLIFQDLLREDKAVYQNNRLNTLAIEQNLFYLRTLQVKEDTLDYVINFGQPKEEQVSNRKEIFHTEEEILEQAKKKT